MPWRVHCQTGGLKKTKKLPTALTSLTGEMTGHLTTVQKGVGRLRGKGGAGPRERQRDGQSPGQLVGGNTQHQATGGNFQHTPAALIHVHKTTYVRKPKDAVNGRFWLTNVRGPVYLPQRQSFAGYTTFQLLLGFFCYYKWSCYELLCLNKKNADSGSQQVGSGTWTSAFLTSAQRDPGAAGVRTTQRRGRCTGDPEAPGELDTKEDRSGTGWQGDHPTIRRTKRGLQPYLTAYLTRIMRSCTVH